MPRRIDHHAEVGVADLQDRYEQLFLAITRLTDRIEEIENQMAAKNTPAAPKSKDYW